MAKGPSMFDLPSLDPSVSATEDLDKAIESANADTLNDGSITVLDEKIKERDDAKQINVEVALKEDNDEMKEQVDVRDARTGQHILEHESNRNGIRLLILTRDATIAIQGSLAERRILALSQVFSEIHIIILGVNEGNDDASLRIAENVWFYRTSSHFWWKMGFDAYRIANEQLTFAGGFRADIILAEDPFESGVTGYYLAKRHERPLQIHVLEDFYDPVFKEQDTHNYLRIYMAEFSLKRADTIRTKSEYLLEEITALYPRLKDHTEVLPLYHNLEAWRDHTPLFSLHERYPQFKFIMLCISAMQNRSHTAEIIAGAAPLLHQYPTIGLIIVGSGPLRSALEKQAIALDVHNQIEFEPTPNEYISHMKSANILIHLSEDTEEDDVVMAAAAVRLPIIGGTRGLAGDLFINDETAQLCENTDATCVSNKINHYLNSNQTRVQCALNAQEVIFDRIEQDYGAYLDAYRESIERALAG